MIELGRRRARDSGLAVLAVIRLLPRVSATLTVTLAAMLAAQVGLSVTFVLATAALIAGLAGPHHIPAGAGLSGSVLADLILVAGSFLLRLVCQPVITAVTSGLGRRLNAYLASATLRGALRPVGISHLADPAVVNEIFQAQGIGGAGYQPGQSVSAVAAVISSRLTGAAAAVLLATVRWWMPLPLMAAWILTGRWRDREVRRAVDAQAHATQVLRHAAYARDLVLTGTGAKEIRVFGLESWLLDRFTAAWRGGMDSLRAGGQWRDRAAAIFLLAGAHAAVLIPLALESAHGQIGLQAVTVAVQSIIALNALGWIGDQQWMLAMASSAVPPALRVSQLAVREAGPGGTRPAAGLPARGIEFESVRFGYPDRPVLSGLNLSLPAGTSLALVGINGAGKSTIIKLLARLYDPDQGRIAVDGTDLRELDPIGWRRQLAVVFQDFVHYELPVRDNVGFGRVDRPRDDQALASVAAQARLDRVVSGLPGGWDTPVSRRLDGGVDLSGGQWQRVALARALFAAEHGARLLVLDEPTAHLDVRAEADLYERFLDLTSGLTTVLVSHRFATVRLADQICVLDDGQIAERGTHDELVAAGGHYAHMFALQSAPFQEEGFQEAGFQEAGHG
jgi:ATP-binding cassette, subfamily B, bacterial